MAETQTLNRTSGASQSKTRSAPEALKVLRSGQRVFIGSGAAEPQHLVEAFSKAVDKLADIEVIHLLTLGAAPYAASAYQGKVRHNALFIGANIREAIRKGRADYTPCFLHEVPWMFKVGKLAIDVALIQVSPPRSGFCSLGVGVDIVKAAAETATHVIAQVNPAMPWTNGDSFVRVEDIDSFVEYEEPILELLAKPITPVAAWIGRYISHLVDDGSTLQLGIGAIPDAVLSALGDKRDLGVHSEMVSDGLVPLIEKGVINGRKKTLHKDKIVVSFCMGSKKLYETIHDNPLFEFYPSDYTNNPFIVAKNDKMVAINSALQIDLTGQVAADSIGSQFYSGFGGQVDFIRGAAGSKGGRSVIGLPSTAKNDTISRIVPVLNVGSGVVTTRADIDFVVTEFGIASLKGKTIRERAIGLIEIAHPKHREELLKKAVELGYVDSGHVLPSEADRYQVDLEATVTLGGSEFFVRPMKPTDEKKLRELFYSQSEDTTYKRFGLHLKSLSERQFQELVAIDYLNSMAIAVFVRTANMERMVAVGRYYVTRNEREAEVAFAVHDEYQGLGIGGFLVNYLAWIARENGVKQLSAQVLVTNDNMRHIFRHRFTDIKEELRDESYHMTMALDSWTGDGNPAG